MDNTWSVAAKYSTCCLLGCKFVGGHDFIAVTATDGHIGLLSIPCLPESISVNSESVDLSKWTWIFASRFQIHQSSIKCLEIIPISGNQRLSLILMTESSVYLLTGGDDNAIHLTEVTFEGESRTTFKPIASVLDAHTSTITGVLNLGSLEFLSVGIDQVIRIWKFDGEKLICRYKADTFVPDVGGIVEIGVQGSKRRFVVFGTGMELLAWEELGKVTSRKAIDE